MRALSSRLLSVGAASLLAVIVLSSGFAVGVQTVSAVSPANDKERLWTEHCLAWERITRPNTACIYGDRTSRVVIALVGDSHASHLFPAINRIAKAHHWKLVVLVKVSCAFADMRLRNIALGREYTECATWNLNVVRRLTALRPALTLVVASRRAMHPVRLTDRSNKAKGLAVGRMLKKVPGQVAVIVDAPFAGNPLRSIPKSVALSYALGAIENVAVRSSGDSLIDLTRATCARWPCPAFVKGIRVFRDMEHFTATFSRTILGAPGGALDRALDALLP